MPELTITTAVILLIIGVALLCKSADVLVESAVGIAGYFGVSPLIIGLTIVSIGTSAPEVSASIVAAVKGSGEIAVGNVFGSNIANLALIGGLCALVKPVSVNIRLLKVEIPIMCSAMVLLLIPMISGKISRLEGFILLAVFLILLLLLVKNSKDAAVKEYAHIERVEQLVEIEKKRYSLRMLLLLAAVSIVALAAAAHITLSAAVFIGRYAGLSEPVVGLTIIAIGTSLPELITCLTASLKNHDDISAGNLVGSNIFNTLLVLAAASLAKPLEFGRILLNRDYIAVLFISALFFVLAFQKRKLTRCGGFALLFSYVVYIIYLYTQ